MTWLFRACAIALLAFGPCLGSTAWAVDISGDDEHDQFVGSAGRPGSAGSTSQGGTAQHSAGAKQACAHCRWLATDPCPPGSSAISCGVVRQTCQEGQVARLTWFSADDGANWENRGLRCLGSAAGSNSGQASTQAVHESFAQAVPAAVIGVQPEHGLLPAVPTLFSSGQPRSPAPSVHRIGSLRILLAPQAHWLWDFGDGTQLATEASGGRYPDRAVSHTYRRAGSYLVQLRTTWTATYTVDGQGPYQVAGAVTQLASTRIQVGQGRAVLS